MCRGAPALRGVPAVLCSGASKRTLSSRWDWAYGWEQDKAARLCAVHPMGAGRSCHWLQQGVLTASLLRTISCCCSVNAKQTFLSRLSTAKVRRLRCRPGECSAGWGGWGLVGLLVSAHPKGNGSMVSPTQGG